VARLGEARPFQKPDAENLRRPETANGVPMSRIILAARDGADGIFAHSRTCSIPRRQKVPLSHLPDRQRRFVMKVNGRLQFHLPAFAAKFRAE